MPSAAFATVSIISVERHSFSAINVGNREI